MLTAEWVQVIATLCGVALTATWLMRCFRNVQSMNSHGKNGVMLLQAWEKISVGLLLFTLQILWLITAIGDLGQSATTPGEHALETSKAIRGAVGSVIAFCIVLVKRWFWIRIIERDNAAHPHQKRTSS